MGRKKKKKGAIELQFNWIFILIVGAVILLFFFGIIKTQREVSEKKISATVRSDMRTILVGAGVSTGTASLVEVPKIRIDYDCEGYSIQGTAPIKQLISFSPDSMYDIRLMLWALDWNIGYRVTNFLYITSPNVRYILFFKNNNQTQHKFVDIVNETLPSRYIEEKKDVKILMNKEKAIVTDDNELKDLEGNSLEDKNNYRVRFIFFDKDPMLVNVEELEAVNDLDVTAIQIKPDCSDGLDCYGKIIFYKKEGNQFKFYKDDDEGKSRSYYLGMSSLIGAIFGDLDTYNCNMENAFKKLQLVTEIYLDKTRVLGEYYTETLNYGCAGVMSDIEGYLEDIKGEVDNILSDFENEFNNQNIEYIYSYITNLEKKNDDAIRLSCAEIY